MIRQFGFGCWGMGAAALAAAFLALVAPLRAHDPMSSWATLEAKPDALVLEAEMGAETAMTLLGLPIDSGITPAKLARVIESLQPRVERGELYRITEVPSGASVPLHSVEIKPEEEDGIRLLLQFAPRSGAEIMVEGNFLGRLHPGHRSALSLLGPDGRVVASSILGGDRSDANFILPVVTLTEQTSAKAPSNGARASPPVAAPELERSAAGLFHSYLLLGFEHILTGYDHLLFLLGLLVACRRIRSVVTMVTCFTLGHSLTLALAALDVVAPPARIVEALIAASLVYVAIENLSRGERTRGRVPLTCLFGLVHGFGFAGVLRDIGFSGGSDVVVPLFAFNLGVELGQLAVVAVVVPVLGALRRWPRTERWPLPIGSAVILVFGLWWLGVRLSEA